MSYFLSSLPRPLIVRSTTSTPATGDEDKQGKLDIVARKRCKKTTLHRHYQDIYPKSCSCRSRGLRYCMKGTLGSFWVFELRTQVHLFSHFISILFFVPFLYVNSSYILSVLLSFPPFDTFSTPFLIPKYSQ
ncbi:hypothetical protein GALMADRAFT_272706 [Galerina marginata CBS 339.88]|uniref:Uncharacterized protein n=1 Tax=Galerina marginata (strain CBS 339.88) TaxID=685588 RepID=A0A067SBL6_GALM3|nr:hypothetical protein GALMADRAFT_272706 [Galerina marginata CBS 339.88]